MTWLPIFLCTSVALNGLLIWYIRGLIRQLLIFSENVADLEKHLDEFDIHLGGVHDLEMFYGDETLGGLIRHSKFIVSKVKEFQSMFSIDYNNNQEDDKEMGEITDGSS
jgi:hypothetical protein|tara:strand:+ start:299 stop:625 length:327 start_codon:yes stop_codon:yes gene_type:complete